MAGIKIPALPKVAKVKTPQVPSPRSNPIGKPPLGFPRILPPRLIRQKGISTRDYGKGSNSSVESPISPPIKSGAGSGNTGRTGES